MAGGDCADPLAANYVAGSTSTCDCVYVGGRGLRQRAHKGEVVGAELEDLLLAPAELRDERLSGRAWELLMMLPTNRSMQAELTALHAPGRPSPTDAEWGSILHSGPSSFKLLYSLQIVDRLMLGGADAAAAERRTRAVRSSFSAPGPVAHGFISWALNWKRLAAYMA